MRYLAMDGGVQFFESVANSFISKNADVEGFFREKSVQATKLNTATTYLVISYENKKFDFLGYFTLATKMLTLKQSSLSKTECKAIARLGYFDEDSQSYKLPAVLIAQFSRNFNESSKSISGDDLMDIALNKIRDILHSTSGKANPILSFCGSCKKNPLQCGVEQVSAWRRTQRQRKFSTYHCRYENCKTILAFAFR